jgi:hypothetical protein
MLSASVVTEAEQTLAGLEEEEAAALREIEQTKSQIQALEAATSGSQASNAQANRGATPRAEQLLKKSRAQVLLHFAHHPFSSGCTPLSYSGDPGAQRRF